MALPVTAFEAILQSKVNPPRTLCWKTQRVRHPELQLQRPKQITSRLTIAVVSSRFAVRQDAKHQITVGKERVGHPPVDGTIVCQLAEPCGLVEDLAAGLALITIGTVKLIDNLHFAKGGSNTKQNAAFVEAVRRIEAALGRKLTPDEIDRLHREISKQGYTLDEIVGIGLGMFSH